MSLQTDLIELYQRFENYIREVRVTPPEGLTMYLQNKFSDVVTYITAHGMTLAVLAGVIGTVVCFALFMYNYEKRKQAERKALLHSNSRDFHKDVAKNNYNLLMHVVQHRNELEEEVADLRGDLNASRKALVSAESIIIDKCDFITNLRAEIKELEEQLEDHEDKVIELRDERDEAQGELEEAQGDVSYWKAEWVEALEERNDALDRVTKLEELVEAYETAYMPKAA